MVASDSASCQIRRSLLPLIMRPAISRPSATAALEANSAEMPAARLVIQKKCSPMGLGLARGEGRGAVIGARRRVVRGGLRVDGARRGGGGGGGSVGGGGRRRGLRGGGRLGAHRTVEGDDAPRKGKGRDGARDHPVTDPPDAGGAGGEEFVGHASSFGAGTENRLGATWEDPG